MQIVHARILLERGEALQKLVFDRSRDGVHRRARLVERDARRVELEVGHADRDRLERRFRGDEDMRARPLADIPGDEPGRHVPRARVVRHGRHGRAAMPAEGALECRRGAEMHDVVGARAPAEALAAHAEARAEQRAVLFAAQRAVAVSEPPVRRRDRARHGAAQTRAFDRFWHGGSRSRKTGRIVGRTGNEGQAVFSCRSGTRP